MRIDIIPFQNVHQFHFDCITGTVTDSTLRTDCNDKVVVDFRCALFDCSDYIFSNVARKPLVNCSHFQLKPLKFIDSHWTNFKKRSSEKVFNPFLSGCQFHSIRLWSGRILQRSFSKELIERSPWSGNSGSNRWQHLFRLLHCRGCSYLMCRCDVNIQEEILQAWAIHWLCSTSGYYEILLINQSFSDRLGNVMSAMAILIRFVYTSLNKIVPTENLFSPNFECIKQFQIWTVS